MKCKLKETIIDGIPVKEKDCCNCDNLPNCDAEQMQAEYLCQQEREQAEAEEEARQEAEAEAEEEEEYDGWEYGV